MASVVTSAVAGALIVPDGTQSLTAGTCASGQALVVYQGEGTDQAAEASSKVSWTLGEPTGNGSQVVAGGAGMNESNEPEGLSQIDSAADGVLSWLTNWGVIPSGRVAARVVHPGTQEESHKLDDDSGNVPAAAWLVVQATEQERESEIVIGSGSLRFGAATTPARQSMAVIGSLRGVDVQREPLQQQSGNPVVQFAVSGEHAFSATQGDASPFIARSSSQRGEYWLGVECVPAPESLRSHLSLQTGLLVISVAPESPARRAGFEEHDVLIKLADQPLKQLEELTLSIQSSQGNSIEANLIRKGRPISIQVRPERRTVPSSELYTFRTVVNDKLDTEQIHHALLRWNDQRVDDPDGRFRMVVVRPGIALDSEDFSIEQVFDIGPEQNLMFRSDSGSPFQITVERDGESKVIVDGRLEQLPAAVQRIVGSAANRFYFHDAPPRINGIPQQFFPDVLFTGVQLRELAMPAAEDRIVVRNIPFDEEDRFGVRLREFELHGERITAPSSEMRRRPNQAATELELELHELTEELEPHEFQFGDEIMFLEREALERGALETTAEDLIELQRLRNRQETLRKRFQELEEELHKLQQELMELATDRN